MAYISPKSILADFLRSRMTDPRARAEDLRTETFNGGYSEYQLVPSVGKVSCVQSISVDSVVQTKWKDYRYDFKKQKIIFFNDTAIGTDNVSVEYKQGTSNWIFPDKALTSLSKSSFPRISILTVGGAGERIGASSDAAVESFPHFQIDVWTKEGQLCTIDSDPYADDKLSEYLGWQVMKAFGDHEEDLHPALYNYTPLGIPRDMPFNTELECFHTIVETELQGINVSEIN